MTDYALGTVGRTPGCLNIALIGYAASARSFAEEDAGLGENVRNYHEYVRDNGWCMMHQQADRVASPGIGRYDPYFTVGSTSVPSSATQCTCGRCSARFSIRSRTERRSEILGVGTVARRKGAYRREGLMNESLSARRRPRELSPGA